MPESARLKDIAEPLGVSEVSVSNALSGKKGVSDKLRSMILEKARELDFDLTRYDRKKNSSPIVGIIIPKRYVDQNRSFYRALYEHLLLEGAGEGFLVVTEIIRGEEEDGSPETVREEEPDAAVLHMMSAGKPDGLFLVGEMGDSYIRRLTGQVDIPVLLLDYYNPSFGCDAVMPDNYMGMYEVTEYLIRRGHREIAFVGAGDSSDKVRERFCGFMKCMLEHHLPVPPERIIGQEDLGLPNSIPASPGALPTAFACSSDSATASTLRTLKTRGLRVPEDVSVAGYSEHDGYDGYGGSCDDLSDSAIRTGVTGYEVDLKAMAETAVRVMTERIEGYKGEPRVWTVVSRIAAKNSVREIF